MIEAALILSLKITAIYVLFEPGGIFGWFRIWVANWIDRHFKKVIGIYIQKPIWDCPFCMASFWTIVLTQSVNLGLMLTVCGIMYLLDKTIISYETNVGE